MLTLSYYQKLNEERAEILEEDSENPKNSLIIDDVVYVKLSFS